MGTEIVGICMDMLNDDCTWTSRDTVDYFEFFRTL